MACTWRVGRKLGRTLYLDDHVVGMVDTPELAARIVSALNDPAECVRVHRADLERWAEQRDRAEVAEAEVARLTERLNTYAATIERSRLKLYALERPAVRALCDEETRECRTVPCARCEFAERITAALDGAAPPAGPCPKCVKYGCAWCEHLGCHAAPPDAHGAPRHYTDGCGPECDCEDNPPAAPESDECERAYFDGMSEREAEHHDWDEAPPAAPTTCGRSPDAALRCAFVPGHDGMHQADGHWWGGAVRACQTAPPAALSIAEAQARAAAISEQASVDRLPPAAPTHEFVPGYLRESLCGTWRGESPCGLPASDPVHAPAAIVGGCEDCPHELEPPAAPAAGGRDCASDFCPDHPRGTHQHVDGGTVFWPPPAGAAAAPAGPSRTSTGSGALYQQVFQLLIEHQPTAGGRDGVECFCGATISVEHLADVLLPAIAAARTEADDA